MAHEWAEELAELALEHHQFPKHIRRPSRVILTREQMAAGERATGAPPYIGKVRSAGEGRWMRFNGQHWGPCDDLESRGRLILFGIDPPMFTTSRRSITYTRTSGFTKDDTTQRAKVFWENIADAFDVPIDLLRGDSDD